MTLISIPEFAREKGILPITMYSIVKRYSVDYVEKGNGVKKPFKFYNKETLENIINERAIKKVQSLARAEFKKSRKKPSKIEQTNAVNVSKLW
jgi:hypothetical protein